MPIPMDLAHAEDMFERNLGQVKDTLDLSTRNQAYTSLQAVLIVFRRRLTAEQVLMFADLLPPVVRAIFVGGWCNEEYVAEFGDRAALTDEVKALRKHHNFTPDCAIAAVTAILRQHMDTDRLQKKLQAISPEAVVYWMGPDT